ncbi:MAG: dehydrogenase [Novosphingobium sp.]|nr:dehydrogenase [Novosphingobium sp.]
MLPLDVTSDQNVAALIEAAGAIDVLVNNAGIGGVGAFEAMPMSLIRQLVETNTIGVMAMCQAIIPQMRERRSGMIVNVTSSVTLGEFPLAAAYTASKHAVEGFTASLAHELRYFGVSVKLVEQGYAPTTRFGTNAIVPVEELLPGEYAEFAWPILEAFARPTLTTRESDVAEAIWAAVHDTTEQRQERMPSRLPRHADSSGGPVSRSKGAHSDAGASRMMVGEQRVSGANGRSCFHRSTAGIGRKPSR